MSLSYTHDLLLHPAPDFELMDQSGHCFSLKKHRGQKIILYFYPKSFTSGCTQQACDFTQSFEKFTEKQILLCGISPDTVTQQARFHATYHLPFLLLSDPTQEVCKKYHVWQEKKMYGKTYHGVQRTTFIINEQGIVEKSYEKVKVKNHVYDLLSLIEKK